MATIGQNLQKIRGTKDQVEIAARLRMKKTTQLSNWENDRYKNVKLKSLLRLAYGYECTVEEIIEGVDPEYTALRATFRDRANTETAHGEPTLAVTAEQSATGSPGASVAGLTGDDGRETSPDRRQAEAAADLAELEFDEVANAIQSLVDILIERHRLATTPRGRPSKARSKQTPRPDRARA
jgi:transcriptional regulator with XRE-family HTH domain